MNVLEMLEEMAKDCIRMEQYYFDAENNSCDEHWHCIMVTNHNKFHGKGDTLDQAVVACYHSYQNRRQNDS